MPDRPRYSVAEQWNGYGASKVIGRISRNSTRQGRGKVSSLSNSLRERSNDAT